jgi:leader peptidase (prepilin peptidase)/N-methyltransferase
MIVALLLGAAGGLVAEALASHWTPVEDRRTARAISVILGAVLGSVDVLRFASTGIETAVGAWLLVLLALAIVDARSHRLPKRLVWAGEAVSLATLAVEAIRANAPRILFMAVEGAVLAAALMLFLWLATKKTMGFGDVRLAVLLGTMLGLGGLPEVVIGLSLGFVLAGVVALLGLALRRVNSSSAIAFGPYLAAGAAIVLLALR